MVEIKLGVGRPADTAKRARILATLTADPANFFEIGTPPYNVGKLAVLLNIDPSNLRKDLLKLEVEGLVMREYRKHQIWNAISGNHQDRKCLCFWNAATMAQDKLAIEKWDSRPRMSDDEQKAMFARFS